MSSGYNVTQAAWINDVTIGVQLWNKITAEIPIKKNSSQLYTFNWLKSCCAGLGSRCFLSCIRATVFTLGSVNVTKILRFIVIY